MYNQQKEQLEFFEFKKDLQTKLLASATEEEFKNKYTEEIEYISNDIRWIQQDIGHYRGMLAQAENDLAREIAWDEQVKSE